MVRRFLFALFCCFLLVNVVLAGGSKKKKPSDAVGQAPQPPVVVHKPVPQVVHKPQALPVVPAKQDAHLRIGHHRPEKEEVVRREVDLTLGGPATDALEDVIEYLDATAVADKVSGSCWARRRDGVPHARRSSAYLHTSVRATSNWDASKALLAHRLSKNAFAKTESYKQAYGRMWTSLFQDADLTINFFSSRWSAPGSGIVISIIDQMRADDRWRNMWQVQFKRYNAPDTKKRDDVELNYLSFQTPLAEKHLAQFEDGRFVPDRECERGERPNYAAANWRKSIGGATNIYGTNYIVLKPHVKLRSTFTPASTFELEDRKDLDTVEAKQLAVGTYMKATGVFAYMEKNFFEDALNVIYNGERSNMPQETYIEAQIFGGIVYDRDIAWLVIDITDYQRTKLKAFAAHNKIPTLYLTDDGTKLCRDELSKCPHKRNVYPPLARL